MLEQKSIVNSNNALALPAMPIDERQHTVYCKSFEVEKFRGFRGLISDRETFPAKLFRSREYHG